MESKFKITNHAMRRICERFPQHRKEINEIIGMEDKKKYVINLLENSSEERGYTNDKQFMINMYDHYGYDKRYSFYINEDAIFIGVNEFNCCIILTILDRHNYHNNSHLKNKKFKN